MIFLRQYSNCLFWDGSIHPYIKIEFILLVSFQTYVMYIDVPSLATALCLAFLVFPVFHYHIALLTGNLTKLVTIDISYNELEEIPAEIGNCTLVTSLDLQYNKLKTIPDSIGMRTATDWELHTMILLTDCSWETKLTFIFPLLNLQDHL